MLPSLRMTASSISEGAWFRSDGEDGSPDTEQKTSPGIAVVYSRSLIKKRSVEGYYYGKAQQAQKIPQGKSDLTQD